MKLFISMNTVNVELRKVVKPKNSIPGDRRYLAIEDIWSGDNQILAIDDFWR